jgi:hypothetical protein
VGWYALVVAMAVFNTVLGEELLFRGVLLTRMRGAFGPGDWIANGILFACHHPHMPWAIPSALLDTLFIRDRRGATAAPGSGSRCTAHRRRPSRWRRSSWCCDGLLASSRYAARAAGRA